MKFSARLPRSSAADEFHSGVALGADSSDLHSGLRNFVEAERQFSPTVLRRSIPNSSTPLRMNHSGLATKNQFKPS
jgi:hypothetical protein